MVRRHELTDAAWARIAPLLPPDPRRGQRWRDHRAVLNGILWNVLNILIVLWLMRRPRRETAYA